MDFGSIEKTCIKTEMPEKASENEIRGRVKYPKISLFSDIMLHADPTSKKDENRETRTGSFTINLIAPMIAEKKIMYEETVMLV